MGDKFENYFRSTNMINMGVIFTVSLLYYLPNQLELSHNLESNVVYF